MNHDEVRDLLDSAWQHFEREARRSKEPNLVVLDFETFYREWPEDDRPTADSVIVEWALSDDENKRFFALAVIEDFLIVSAIPASRELADRFENSKEVLAPYDWAKVNRKIGRLVAAADEQRRSGEPRAPE